MKQRRNQGITLIALVITIIVLLILAGVSIAMLTGQNGILNQASGAKETNNKATALEKVQTEVMGSYGENGKIDVTKLNENLAHIKNIQGTPITSLPAAVAVDGYEITINTNGNVAILNVENKTIAEVKPGEGQNVTFVTGNTKIKDDKGNQVIIPEGFGVAKDSATIVTDGVVIEDSNGNQFVWIPVGTVTKSDGTTAQIKLSRYIFERDGTPIEQGENVIDTYYQELSSSDKGNTVAKDIEGFKTSANYNHGYYLARYEASKNTTTGKLESKSAAVWNNITQSGAARASKNMYTSNNFTSDLVNSYAWDTAIIFIQTFSGDTDYSKQDGKNINSSLVNTGVNGDEKCHIHDMASNALEWTTETSNEETLPCVYRGGYYVYDKFYASSRDRNTTSAVFEFSGFRPILYV